MTKKSNMIPCEQKEKIESLEIMNKALIDDIGQIKDALLPSEFHPDNGLILSVSKLKKDVEDIKKQINKFKIQLSTVVGIASIVYILIELYFNIKK